MFADIRNKFAHCNVKIIDKYESNKIGDVLLNFKDYSETELNMDLTIKVSDFEKLLRDENYMIITEFINSKVIKK